MARCTGMESKQTAMCPQCKEAMDRAETCIREHPRQAALTCLGAGFLLSQLPLRLLIGSLVRVVLWLLKPTVMLYGIYRLAEDVHSHQHLREDAEI